MRGDVRVVVEILGAMRAALLPYESTTIDKSCDTCIPCDRCLHSLLLLTLLKLLVCKPCSSTAYHTFILSIAMVNESHVGLPCLSVARMQMSILVMGYDSHNCSVTFAHI